MLVGLRCVREPRPGDKWKEGFDRTWPHYQEWYLGEGRTARPSYLDCRAALRAHMPELTGIYATLCELAGGGDLAARYLSLYEPPPFMSGCTQLVWPGSPPTIVRNYDYDPRWFEGVMLYTEWIRPVIAMADCNWGVLDGINGDGLAVSLAFGGRRWTGSGFGIPLVLRYLLETCATVAEARVVLRRLPVHMAYNVVLLDSSGDHATAFLGPGRAPGIDSSRVSSNHQEQIDWPEYAEATATREREAAARAILNHGHDSLSAVVRKFLQPPLYNLGFEKSFGTLYTAAWTPSTGSVRIAWPHTQVEQSFGAFEERALTLKLRPQASEYITR